MANGRHSGAPQRFGGAVAPNCPFLDPPLLVRIIKQGL